MEFKLRNELLVLIQDNATAFATASKFVDSEDKLEVSAASTPSTISLFTVTL